jgi:hypothetical protein
VSASPVAPVSLQLVKCTLEKRVAQAGENWVSGKINRILRQRSLYFTVPAGTGEFQVEIKTARLRGRVHCGVVNAAGALVAENEWEVGAQPLNEWEVFNLDAGRPEKDETWQVTLNEAGETYLRFTGVPGYVASSPEELFTPDAAARRELPPVEIPPGDGAVRYAGAGLPWGGQTAYLAKEFVLAAPAGWKIFDEKQGTVEMWVKATDGYSALSGRNLLRSGSFSLFRRSNIGTYAAIGGSQFQRFFILPGNRWTHLAFTWRPANAEGANLEIRLFADGIEIKGNNISASGTPFKKVPPGWTGEILTVSNGVFASNLRVSDCVRYENSFRRPEAPFEPDEHTRVLCRFDGTGEAWIAGKKTPVP